MEKKIHLMLILHVLVVNGKKNTLNAYFACPCTETLKKCLNVAVKLVYYPHV